MTLDRLVLAPILLILAPLLSAQADVPCDPSTALQKQSRTDMKHRKPASPGTMVAGTTRAEMLNWDTPEDIADRQTRTSESPVDDLEEEAFVVGGSIVARGEAGNDCDYHLEISAPDKGKTALRIIAEIPQGNEYADTRESLLSALTPTDREKLRSHGCYA